MKLHDIIFLLETDYYVISYREEIETIFGTVSGSYGALRKYFDLKVEKIIPINNGVEIHLVG